MKLDVSWELLVGRTHPGAVSENVCCIVALIQQKIKILQIPFSVKMTRVIVC